MAMSLKELENQLNMQTYTPKTDEQMRAEAESRYKTVYNQNRQAAQQKYDASALALDQQRAGLADSYAKQSEAAQKSMRQNYAAADRQALTRGMQRSSYNNATLANINVEGAKLQNDIQQGLTTAQGNIDQQKALLTQQLAEALAGYDTGYVNDVEAYIDSLKQQEYERTTSAEQYRNQLLMALYEYGLKGSGGGGGGRSHSGGGGSSSVETTIAPTNAYSSLLSALGGASAGSSANKAGAKTSTTAQKPSGTSEGSPHSQFNPGRKLIRTTK